MNSRIPSDLRGVVRAAFRGGLSVAYVLNVVIPTYVTDISGAYPWAYVDLDLRRFDVADNLRTCDVTDEVRCLANKRLRPAILAGFHPMSGRAVLVEVAPQGEARLPSKVRRDDCERLHLSPIDLGGSSLWWWLDDVLAGVAFGDQFPVDVRRAVEFVPIGVRADLRPVPLPTGRLVDPREECLVEALIEERHRCEEDPSLAHLVQMLKRLAIVVTFGNRARIDRGTVRREVLDEAMFLDRLVDVETLHPERPGPDFDPLIAGMVTARVRLVICEVIGQLRELAGQVLHVSTDAVAAAATPGPDPAFVPCRGGAIREGAQRGFFALPIATIDEILRRTGAPWKPVAGHDEETFAYVCGTQKMTVVRGMNDVVLATEFLLGDVYWDPTGTGERIADGKAMWAVLGGLAVVRQGMAWSGKGGLPELELPPWGDHLAVRSGQVTTPTQLERLQRPFPDRTVRLFQRYGTACFGARTPEGLVAVTLDVGMPPERWRDLDWRHAETGERLDLTGVDATFPVGLVPWTIRDLLMTWRSARDASLAPVVPSEGMLVVGVCDQRPVWSDEDHFEAVGKDGDRLAYYLLDPLADNEEDAVTIYRRVDHWPLVQAKAVAIGTAELMRLVGLPERTARAVVANEEVSSKTKRIVAEALRYVGEVVIRTCAVCGKPLRPRQRTHCSTECRMLAEAPDDRASA